MLTRCYDRLKNPKWWHRIKKATKNMGYHNIYMLYIYIYAIYMLYI